MGKRTSSKHPAPTTDRQTRQSSHRQKPTSQVLAPSLPPAAKSKSRPAPADIESSSDEGSDSDSKEDRSIPEDDDNLDLQDLDGESLHRKLFSERVTVSKNKAHKSTPSSETDGEAGLYSHPKRLFLSDRSDGRDESQALDNDSKNSSDGSVQNRVETSRDKARRSEVPKFRRARSTPIRAHQHQRPTSNLSSDEEDEHDVNEEWHKEAHYQPFSHPARILGVKEQPTPLRVTIKAAIRQAIGDMVFVTAYPNIDISHFNNYHRQLLVDSARRLNYEHLAKRFEKDDELLKLTATVLNGRSSRIRTQCKDITDSKIEGFYISVTSPSDTSERVAYLIEDMNYIYPTKEQSQVLDTNRPYCHPAIISSIKQSFFVGDRGAVANRYSDRFTSSTKSDTRLDQELELPIAMVSLVATTIHASLVKWDVNDSQKSKGFRAEHYDDIYNAHEMFLKDLATQKPKFFHKIMHELHKTVATKKATSAVAMSRNAMARLSIPNEEEL